MSSINTGSINVNYPVPGVNNNSQGFRDNFSGIRTNLNTAATEITDLQNNVVVKNALAGTTLNNDMANTLISNAAIQGFRSTTFNLGTNLSGQVIVDATLGDVQYGTITANTSLQFAKWAPTGTQSTLQTILTFANVDAYVTFPTNVTVGASTLENYIGSGVGGSITIGQTSNTLHHIYTTIDCGTNIEVTPVNYPRNSVQVINRVPTEIGRVGDGPGSICYGDGFVWVCSGYYDGSSSIWTGIPASEANIQIPKIVFGTSRVEILDESGDIQISVGDNSNIAYFSNSQVVINSPVSAQSLNTFGSASVGVLNSPTVAAGNVNANVVRSNLILLNGNLTSLANSNSFVNFSNSTVTLGNVANLSITGGSNGQFLRTDGGGTLSWATISGNGSTPAGANNQIQFNNNGNLGASANFLFNSSSQTMTLNGTANVNGNINSASLNVTSNLTISGNAVVNGNLTVNSGTFNISNTNGAFTVGGNLTTNSYLNGASLSVIGNANVGNIGTAALVATGNVTLGDAVVNGNLTVNSGTFNISSSNGAFTVGGNLTTQYGYLKGARLSVAGNANVGNIGTTALVATGNVTTSGSISGRLITTTVPPSSATSSGVAGQIAYDSNFIYVCTGTDTWRRSPFDDW